MKIYINSAKENWVVDRFIDEWNKFNFKQSKNFRFGDKIVWLIAPWTWSKVNSKILNNKKVICTIHHLDMDKFDHKQEKDFLERDKFVDIYHSISDKTSQQISRFTDKKIKTIPFWLNQNIWFQINEKKQLTIGAQHTTVFRNISIRHQFMHKKYSTSCGKTSGRFSGPPKPS